jgi:hypothetical protein
MGPGQKVMSPCRRALAVSILGLAAFVPGSHDEPSDRTEEGYPIGHDRNGRHFILPSGSVYIDPVYERHCRRCHGLTGRLRPGVDVSRIYNAKYGSEAGALENLLRSGRQAKEGEAMPAFRNLSKGDIAHIHFYLRPLADVLPPPEEKR